MNKSNLTSVAMLSRLIGIACVYFTIVPQAQSDTISTPFASNSGGSAGGANFFDVVNSSANPVRVDGTFRFNFDNLGAMTTVNGYYHPGTWVGTETNMAAWTLFGTATVTSLGDNNRTPADLGGSFIIPAGQTYALLFSSSAEGWEYTAGTGVGNVAANDGVLRILEGGANNTAFGLGTFSPRVWNGELDYTIITPITAAGQRATLTYLVTNLGAILSANSSGLGMGLVNPQVVQGAPNAALRDYDSRLFRARSGMGSPVAMASTIGGDASLLRYLAFMQDENMSYRVALGLADPEERTIELNMADTLAAQTGGAFSNGQTLGGGLPYAMMGVPLMPMAGGAATVQIVEAGGGKAVIDDAKAVVEAEPLKRWELFTAGDFSFYDQDQLSDLMQGFDTDTYAGTIGLEYRVKEWLNLGLGWSYLESDTNVSGNYGDIDLEGNLITGYATAFWRQYWADLLYSYGSFNSDINRNTGLGSRARGDTDSDSHNIRLNLGHNFNIRNDIVTGPIAGLRYSNGSVDPYSESGGGSAALDYEGTDFESMVSSLGWQATHFRSTNWGRLVSQVHLAWEHEYMPENGTVAASLQTSPFALVTGGSVRRIGGYSTESDGAHPGTDWLSAGAGLRFELANGVAFLTDYEGVFFRSNAAQHYASAKVSYEWGAIMPGGGGGKAVSGKAVAYEPLPDEQTGQQVAEASEPAEAEQAQVAEKKLSGGFASWLRKKDRKPEVAEATKTAGSPSASPEPKHKGSGKVEPVGNEKEAGHVLTKPAAKPIPSSSSKEGMVVYKTWDEVPGLKETAAAPAKPVGKKDPSS